jgi:hypothetical protein
MAHIPEHIESATHVSLTSKSITQSQVEDFWEMLGEKTKNAERLHQQEANVKRETGKQTDQT